jgi:2,4-dichlorophenol 6-monooxygenase
MSAAVIAVTCPADGPTPPALLQIREGAMDNTTLPPPLFVPFPSDGSGYDTDVVVVGLGPAGGVAALALATYGVRVHAVTMFPWVANSPRAHITNQRAVEVLRDLGVE